MRSLEDKIKKAAYQKAYNVAHREELHISHKTYQEGHREEINAKRRVYRLAHREKFLSYQKQYRVAHREERRSHDRIYRIAHLGKRTAYLLLLKYGLTPAAFDSLLESQGHACAICKKEDWNGRGPQVDHDHVTGKVRGILCNDCNRALGAIRDNPKTARAMGDYLEVQGTGFPFIVEG